MLQTKHLSQRIPRVSLPKSSGQCHFTPVAQPQQGPATAEIAVCDFADCSVAMAEKIWWEIPVWNKNNNNKKKDFTLPWPFTASNCLICFLSSVEISDQEMQPGVPNSPTEQTGTSGLVMGAGEHLCQKEWVLITRENQATDSPELLISG